MTVRFLTGTQGNCIFGSFQLHNYTGKALRESVVDVPRHAIALFEYCRPLSLFGKVVQLKRQHDLMGQGLGKLDLLRSVWRTIDMANADKAFDLSADQKRHTKKSPGADLFQTSLPFAVDPWIRVH